MTLNPKSTYSYPLIEPEADDILLSSFPLPDDEFLHDDEQLLPQELPQLSAQSPLQLFEQAVQDEDCELPSHVVVQPPLQELTQPDEQESQEELVAVEEHDS